MIKIFNIYMMTEGELFDYWIEGYDKGKSNQDDISRQEGAMYHCGRKGCQYHTQSPEELSTHREMHKG